MSYLVIAYPQLSEADAAFIEAFRRIHDLDNVDVVAVHWTLIFPVAVEDVPLARLTEHVEAVARSGKPIEFHCRYALVFDDACAPHYYLFLVPDEGFSGISLLHDQLYSDFLRPHLRLDIPYVPHMGMAMNADPVLLKELADEWNQSGRVISGRVESLTLASYDGTKVQDLQSFALEG